MRSGKILVKDEGATKKPKENDKKQAEKEEASKEVTAEMSKNNDSMKAFKKAKKAIAALNISAKAAGEGSSQLLNADPTPFLPKPNAETESDREKERKSGCDPSSHRSVTRAAAGGSSPSLSSSSMRAAALCGPAIVTSMESASLSPRLFPPPLNPSRAPSSEEPPLSLLIVSLRAVTGASYLRRRSSLPSPLSPLYGGRREEREPGAIAPPPPICHHAAAPPFVVVQPPPGLVVAGVTTAASHR
nr:uncharacterized protein DDB_G0284459-like [Arachis hypogaea]